MGLFGGTLLFSSKSGQDKAPQTRKFWFSKSRTSSHDDTHICQQNTSVDEQTPDKGIRDSDHATAKTEVGTHDVHDSAPSKHAAPDTQGKENVGGAQHLQTPGGSVDPGMRRKGSRGFDTLRTMFNSQRVLRHKSSLELLRHSGRIVSYDARHSRHEYGHPKRAHVQEMEYIAQGSINKRQRENAHARNFSDQTVDSSVTDSTVYRDPERRPSSPILGYAGEKLRDSSSELTWNPFTDASRVRTESTRPSTSDCVRSVMETADLTYDGLYNPFVKQRMLNSRKSSRADSTGDVFSVPGAEPVIYDKRCARTAYDLLAAEWGLPRLPARGRGPTVSGTARSSCETNGRTSGIVRSMRSALILRHEPVSSDRQTLRHTKTFGSLRSRPQHTPSLKGRDLETLARLGGSAILTLPGDFAPQKLKLPACFVETAQYLALNAPRARNVFIDPGDPKTVKQLYDHYAKQILSAEKDQVELHIALRATGMPAEMDLYGVDSPRKRTGQARSVATVFKSLLSGLPGGILGSPELYSALRNIHNQRFSPDEKVHVDGSLAGSSPAVSAQTKLITLAVLALTDRMQLDLICAVFGLCQLLIYETERVMRLESQAYGISMPRFRFFSGGLDVERLGCVFGPLLTNGSGGGGGGGGGGDGRPDAYTVMRREIESEMVATMLVAYWRLVSRQLRVWAAARCPPGRRTLPSMSSGVAEPEVTGEEGEKEERGEIAVSVYS